MKSCEAVSESVWGWSAAKREPAGWLVGSAGLNTPSPKKTDDVEDEDDGEGGCCFWSGLMALALSVDHEGGDVGE